jgi:hypothetical protein
MEDIAIASVAAAVKEEGAGRAGGGDAAAAETEPAGLVERFETMHQRVAAGKAAVAGKQRAEGGLFSGMGSARGFVVPAAWGSAAGGAVLGLALYFRPRPLLAVDEDDPSSSGAPPKLAKLRLAAWVGGAFAVAAVAAAASRRFKR